VTGRSARAARVARRDQRTAATVDHVLAGDLTAQAVSAGDLVADAVARLRRRAARGRRAAPPRRGDDAPAGRR